MTTQIPCAFLICGEKYELIGVAGSESLTSEGFEIPLEELNKALSVTYEIAFDTVYLTELIFEERKVHDLSIRGVERTGGPFLTAYRGLKMIVPFSGRIRIAKNSIKEPYINTSYQKAVGFETVLDITVKDGQIFEVKNRSLEMKQKREALKRCHESEKRLKEMGYPRAVGFKVPGIRGVVGQDRRVIDIAERWEGMEQGRCALKEYFESAARLEKVLYSYGMDIDLE